MENSVTPQKEALLSRMMPDYRVVLIFSFFPSEAQLHFTLVTNAGNIYEASTTESITLEKGSIMLLLPLLALR